MLTDWPPKNSVDHAYFAEILRTGTMMNKTDAGLVEQFPSSVKTLEIAKEDQKAFEQFLDLGISRWATLLVGGIILVGTSYVYGMSLACPKDWNFVSVVAAFGFLVRNPVAILIMFYANKIPHNPTYFMQAIAPWFPTATNIVSILTPLTLGLFLIARVYNGQCESFDQLHIWSCNSEYESNALPQELVVSLMLLPIVYAVGFKTIRTKSVHLCWLICVSSIAIAIGVGGAVQSIPSLIVYAPISIVLLYEVHRQNVVLFLMMKNQKLLLEANKQLSEESQNELRFMIANMAHDLKTPLSAFMNGVETMSSLVADMGTTRSTCKDFHAAVKENLHNLQTVNNFMTMTVNRCIDYMKASKGIKLEPRLETINLQEVLSMPLNCMRDLQSRIAIIQKPIPGSVCSHIITDLQWFQENLFCLISNAVKYSSHGHISVSLTLTTDANPQINAAMKKRRASSVSTTESDSAAYAGPAAAEKYYFLDRLARSSPQQGCPPPSPERMSDLERGEGSSKSNNSYSKVWETTLSRMLKKSNKTAKVYAQEFEPAVAMETEFEVMLLVEVEDTGIGLSDVVKETLFTPFKQAQRRAGGTGLGLYSLAKRVDALGGYYGVSNRRDGEQGSIFWFAIPYRPDTSPFNSRASLMRSSQLAMVLPEAVQSIVENEEVDAKPVDDVSPLSMTSIAVAPPPGKLRILLVDDSVTILKMTSNLLKRHGHVVDQEENGADALTRLARTRGTDISYDVMLIDLNMPVMDGLEATKRLREVERSLFMSKGLQYHQKVFAFSANSDNATLLEAMEAGADDFITKPFTIQTFNEKVEKWDIGSPSEN